MKKKILIAFSIILALILILIGIVYFYIHNKVSQIEYVEVDKGAIEINEGVEESLEEYRNIALLGIDNTDEDYGEGNRSDCIIIASINKKTNEVNLISVYRDTYFEIVGRDLDKVNHAYSFGGPELAMSTLNTNMDLDITEFVVVNFDTVADTVNALGGVEIEITKDEIQYINNYISSTSRRTGIKSSQITKVGKQNLDGVQAVAYSRIRYTEGQDYKRTERMRTVLTAMFEKAKGKGIGEINTILTNILPKMRTNISTWEIISLLPQMTSFKVNESIGWPYDTKGYDVYGPYYGAPVTLESNTIRLHKEMLGQENYTPTQRVIDISEKIANKTGYR